MIIKARHDTAAYLKAYEKFIISKAAANLTRRTMDEMGISTKWNTIPSCFKLFNEDGEDISNIEFISKKEAEDHILLITLMYD